jgi:hypothetical protein
MTTPSPSPDPNAFARREFVTGALKTAFVASVWPLSSAEADSTPSAPRCVNIMNFIRAEEPREPMDLMTPVREQMARIKAHKFPATWLLQYDALVEGPFVEFLKAEMPPEHEVGIWFEMNRKICDDAGIAWRGDPNWEWDYHVPVAYAIGYTPEERRKLADTAAATFKRVFGKDLKSVASWNLDAISVAHFADRYGVDAFGNCRDQLATDGFTIWGVPIAAYYPSRNNAWSPALDRKNQIPAPMFRLLGQDPVYYYDNTLSYPDTMEPAWRSGQSEVFVDRFLDMIAHQPTQTFGYVQIGQENSFGWPAMGKGFAMQMDKLAQARSEGRLILETMGETGRRFKRLFKSTPPQAQVMLEDPFGHTDAPERTVWYQSKFLRANLHFRGSEFYLRDLHVYTDRFPQPFLTETVRQHGIEQRLLAALDGYHWSDDATRAHRSGRRALGRFVRIEADSDGRQTPLTMAGLPVVTETASMLQTRVPLDGGGELVVVCREREISFRLVGGPSGSGLGLLFEWDPTRTALRDVTDNRLHYRFRDFDYSVQVGNGVATRTPEGVRIVGGKRGALRLLMAQRS